MGGVIFICVVTWVIYLLVMFTKLHVWGKQEIAESSMEGGARLTIHQILEKYFTYYRELPLLYRKKFVKRLKSFIEDKSFEGEQGFTITDEVKVLIGASAIQLTFGLRKYRLPHLHTIKVYPSIFMPMGSRAKFKGYTDPRGLMALSWKDFVKGYSNPHDKINLGLHEMAHALKVEAFEGDNFDEMFSDMIAGWLSASKDTIKELAEQPDENTFLRAYGGKNEDEFFAVCVEHFFEAPDEFEKELPSVFKYLKAVLRQDPRTIGKKKFIGRSPVSAR